MEHLNYCRQIRKQFQSLDVSGATPLIRGTYAGALYFAGVAEKFLLPMGGRINEDRQYRALDESERLRLPYPVIALEYYKDRTLPIATGTIRSSKSVCFAAETNYRARDLDHITIIAVAWLDERKYWTALPPVYIPVTGYLDRSRISKNGWVASVLRLSDDRVPLSDYSDEVGTLLCFLNILQCSNVETEISKPKKEHGGKSIEPALKFDSYHILTIAKNRSSSGASHSSTHRSPREHLRRGHIRVCASGIKTWVNAAVIGAGRGAGVVKKDYVLRGALPPATEPKAISEEREIRDGL